MIATGEDLFFMAACFTLVLTYLFCGAIRWCNLWRPFNEDTDQLFPARRIVTINYLAAGLLIPCLFHPFSPDAWLCARSFFLLHIPTFSILTFQSFFFGHYKKNKRQILLIGAIPIGLLLLLSGFACAGGNHLAGQQKMILSLVGIISVSLATYLCLIIFRLGKKIYTYNHDEFSNEDDFPIHFASSIILIPIFFLAVAWTIFLANNRFWLACFMIAASLAGFLILLVILHPQRTPGKNTEKRQTAVKAITETMNEEDPENRSAKHNQAGLPEAMLDKIEKQIREVVEGENLFMDPNLTRAELESKIHVNRSYLTITFRERFISFYNYLNVLRMEQAIRYANEHPEAKQQEIADNSGFGSLRSYSRARKLYQEGELRNIWEAKKADN